MQFYCSFITYWIVISVILFEEQYNYVTDIDLCNGIYVCRYLKSYMGVD